jgi:tRNA-modifying protein YgfZ
MENTPQGEAATDRRIYTLTGADALPFLQGMLTNDVLPLAKSPGIVWAALLTPQGKYLADFFVVRTPDNVLLLDIKTDIAEATMRRLSMYRLRADVQIEATDMPLARGLGPQPAGALQDPRHPALGWRDYCATGTPPQIDWNALRVAHLIPETGIELTSETYILEAGFEALNGVDFRKGCYVGQEVTARMKHKTELRKGLTRLAIAGSAPQNPIPIGCEILAEGKPAGTLYTQSAGTALAHLRFDKPGALTANGIALTRL